MKTPKSVDLAITAKCNLHCAYCAHFSSASDVAQDISTEEWLDFFKELNQAAVLEVTLAGGEPFFRPDIKELIQGIIDNRLRFSVLSNGTLIDEKIVAFIASTKRCNYVQVSIDGSGPPTHDAIRGAGNFNRALEGIKILREHGVPTAVRVTINKHNVFDLSEIARLLLEEISLNNFSTNAASYQGLCRKNPSVQLDIDDRSYAMKELLRLNRKYNGRISAAAGPLAEANSWLKIIKASTENKSFVPSAGYLLGCGGVFTQLAVRADGIIIPCSLMGHIELGRINRDRLEDIWQNHPELNKLRARRSVSLEEFDFCKGCKYIKYCTGSCPALAYTLTGSEYHPSPDSCLKRFLEAGGVLPEEELVSC
jgi:SynChlorMet cassette radical SAM/SPASM protein ScmE